MYSIEYLRRFVNERQTAAAEEILGTFQTIIAQYEEEINRQRGLLDIVWKPEIKLHRIELLQQHVYKEEEVVTDPQLCSHEMNSSLDQENPEPPQFKEEPEELGTSQDGEQLVLKRETDICMLTPTKEERDISKVETPNFNPDKSQNASETELPESVCISGLTNECSHENSEVSEPKSDDRLPSSDSHVDESQDKEGAKHVGSGSTRITKPKPKKRHHRRSHSKVYNHDLLEIHSNVGTGKKLFKCETCAKEYIYKCVFERHVRSHTAERPFSCRSCGQKFCRISELNIHIRTHTGDKPYSCNTCNKSFKRKSELNIHSRIHTGEKPHSCKTCGKDFRFGSELTAHMRTHTGEKPYLCKICGERFSVSSVLKRHVRMHTGENPFSCKTCGKDFFFGSDLKVHMRIHTGEKSYVCKTCGKRFCVISELEKHTSTHRQEGRILTKDFGKASVGCQTGKNAVMRLSWQKI